MIKAKEGLENEYVIAAKSLGINSRKIYAEIEFKQLLPLLKDSFTTLHLNLWGLLIAYEYIQHTWGLGTIINNSIQYRDLSTLFSISLLLSLTIISGNYILKFIFNRFIHWE